MEYFGVTCSEFFQGQNIKNCRWNGQILRKLSKLIEVIENLNKHITLKETESELSIFSSDRHQA